MPELPEVESLRRLLVRSVVGRTIVHATVTNAALRRRVPSDFARQIVGRRIERLGRRAKYLMVELGGELTMLVHLGMSGSLTRRCGAFPESSFDRRHDHLELKLDDRSRLVFNDPRRFGLVKLVARADAASCSELRALGPEPLGPDFNSAYLAQKARGRRAAIKNFLMDQKVVAGIGNIYAAEILFRAGVRPARRVYTLSRTELKRIAEATPNVLREAIGLRGTTFRSYRDSRGKPGAFSRRLKVYGRENEPCPRCWAPIKNVVVGQRASFFCPRCQH
jgi:formamidopyrimidine-DNA glycosylase